ncbi:hypothetical protein K438DRAFT_774984 [Mycena galopus ATCC 62051]|nr:hypothetical protein K438DRAFT_774984 [Mycena galopus ATCC 62051]
MTIDGGPPTFWIPPTSATQTNNLIYSSGTLLPGNHTLVVTATTNQPVWADYFLVVPNPVDFVAPVSSSAPASNSVTASSAPSSSSTSQSSHKSTPVGEIVGPIIGVLAVVAILAAIFFRLRRRHHYEGHTDPSMMSDVEAAAPVPAFGGAGPPPSLSHGYSTELGLGPFATPNQPISSANADASGSGASQHEPGSYFGTPLAPNRATSSHGAASASSPGTIRSSGPNSTTSEDVYNDVNVNVPPTVRSGMVPSNKLLREAQRAAQWHVSSPSTSGSVTSSGVQDVPPNYSE